MPSRPRKIKKNIVEIVVGFIKPEPTQKTGPRQQATSVASTRLRWNAKVQTIVTIMKWIYLDIM